MTRRGRRRHCWLRFRRHGFRKTGGFSFRPLGFHMGQGGPVRLCRVCGWTTTTRES